MDIFTDSFTNGKVVLICPGKDGSMDGYGGKYKSLAENIIKQKLAAVVRISNPNTDNQDREVNLRSAIEYIRKNSLKITGYEKFELSIIGVSAGARSAALLASNIKELKNLLLIEPAAPFDSEQMIKSLRSYGGKIGIVVGQGGDSLGMEVGNIYKKMARDESQVDLTEIKNSDHHFSDPKATEELNEWIMTRLTNWL